MLESFIKALFEQGREASLVVYLLATLVFGATALHRDWLMLGKPTRKQLDACDKRDTEREATLVSVNEKLVDQRILNAQASATIAGQQERIRQLELDVAKSEGREWHTEQRRERRR